MFVYYKLYREPVSPMISTPRCREQENMAVLGIEVVLEKARSVRPFVIVFLFYKRPTSLLANRPLLLQPQQAPHKHETDVANPQYLLH